MASSNRHWPSMFKSKPHNHQWHHDPSLTPCQRTPYAPSGDERSPEPKPRWNPKPEQIRILESIFNSGMVNPPRDEIRKIRVQLQEYGQVGDANVFYWFQNRKSRSKHKLRHLQNSKNNNQQKNSSSSLPQIPSSNSSEKSSPNKDINHFKNIGLSNLSDVGLNNNSPTASVNQQTYFQAQNGTNLLPPPPITEPFYFPLQQNEQVQGVMDNAITTTEGLYFSEFSNMVQLPQSQVQENVRDCTSMWVNNEIMNFEVSSKKDQDQVHHNPDEFSFGDLSSSPTDTAIVPASFMNSSPVTVPSPTPQLRGVGDDDESAGRAKCTVLINDVAFEVAVGPFNVREAFGNQAVLIDSSGHPLLTDEWGLTIHSLQHGASYYLV